MTLASDNYNLTPVVISTLLPAIGLTVRWARA